MAIGVIALNNGSRGDSAGDAAGANYHLFNNSLPRLQSRYSRKQRCVTSLQETGGAPELEQQVNVAGSSDQQDGGG
jgi:hypothetical protein